MFKTVFQNMIPGLTWDISNNNRIIGRHPLCNVIHALIYVYHLTDVVLIIPGTDLIFQPKGRTFSIDQYHLPGWE